MSKNGRRYPREFKENAVELWRNSGATITQTARDLGISDRALGNWITQFGANKEEEALTEESMEESERLRQENLKYKMRNDALKQSGVFRLKRDFESRRDRWPP